MCLNQQPDNDKVRWKYVVLLFAECYFMLIPYVMLMTFTDYRPLYYASK